MLRGDKKLAISHDENVSARAASRGVFANTADTFVESVLTTYGFALSGFGLSVIVVKNIVI